MMCRWYAVAAAVVVACSAEPPGVSPPIMPVIETSSVEANAGNVISALVSVRAGQADSVAVRFHVAGLAGADSLTAAVTPTAGAASVPVLGLLPETRYVLHAIAYGSAATAVGAPLDFTTGALPADLPSYSASAASTVAGFVVFASGRYGLVVDRSGRVVWYRKFEGGPGLNFMAEPTGHYVARPPNSTPGVLTPWVEVDVLGNVTRSFGCARGLTPRFHDLLEERDGSYWMLCDETRTMDLTAHGGVVGARVTGTAVQHISADGTLLFDWSAFDHLSITDLAPGERTGATVNWTHGNALDLDVDGNLIVSFRSLDEIAKIDVATGNILWRLGGRANQFTFVGGDAPAFAHQHGARLLDASTLLLLDNLGNPTESRAERYVIDQRARTARLVQSHGSSPGVVTEIGGSVQGLAGSRTLVSFGTAGRIEEYDASDRLIWRIDGNPGYVFRAQWIRSLYAPGVGSPR